MRKKPTTAQLVARIYRKQLEVQHDLENQLASVRLDVAAFRHQHGEQLARLIANQSKMLKHVDHFALRLAPLDEVNRYMARPLK